MKKEISIKFIYFSLFLIIIFISIGYSAFNSVFTIDDVVLNIRAKADIRITNISVEPMQNGTIAEGENYNINSIKTSFTLPNKDSSITYKLSITNFEGPEMGILKITGLPDYLVYTIENYTLKDKLCSNTEENCSAGMTKDDILLTIKYADTTSEPTITNHTINLDFDFREIYNITYSGIENTNNKYPTETIGGDTLEINFSDFIPYNVVPYINNTKLEYEKYSYENDKLTIDEVTGNIMIEYIEKVYLKNVTKQTNGVTETVIELVESQYLDKIKTIQFVNYINIPSDVAVTYDLSKNSDKSVMGWLDNNNNFYIGSDWKIYTETLAKAFNNMTTVESINFKNLDGSNIANMSDVFNGCKSLKNIENFKNINTEKVVNMYNMFYNCSSLTSLDLSHFNTTNVKTMQQMFYGCENLETINLSSFNTSNVTQLNSMFYGCKKLVELDISNFVINKSRMNLVSMFNGCESLEYLDIRSITFWDYDTKTNKVTGFYGMFGGLGRKATEQPKIVVMDTEQREWFESWYTSSGKDPQQIIVAVDEYYKNLTMDNIITATDFDQTQ